MNRTPTDQQAIDRHFCPKCHQPRGKPCVYVAPANYSGYASTPRGRALAARIGTEMVGTHQERRSRYWRALASRRRHDELEEMKAHTPPWLVPLREFDKAENEKMREWLRANALRIFRLRRL